MHPRLYKVCLLAVLLAGIAMLGSGCCSYQGTIPRRYDIMYHALESDQGGMICITKANIGNHSYEPRSEVYIHDNLFQPAEYPNLIIEKCGILPDHDIDFMTLKTNQGVLILHRVEGALKVSKPAEGNLSTDALWFVDRDQMTSIDTGSVKAIPHLPGEFIGNAPDWKTVVTEGRDLIGKDLHSLNLVDLETGRTTEIWLKRSRYLFLLNHAHQIEGIVCSNFWIAMHFRWDQDEKGKYSLVYPRVETAATATTAITNAKPSEKGTANK